MKRSCVVWIVVIGLARTAAAQAPGQIEPASAAFLEKRVPDELATEGVVLSRRNLGLQIEQLGDRWLVSLADLTTGRVAASTKVDTLPVDREAAVATMTHVVAELAAQIVGRGEPPPRPAPAAPAAAPAPQGQIDDRAERAQREIAELKFKRQSIRFGTTYELLVSQNHASLSPFWVTYQGDLDQALEPLAFYRLVGRPDLGQQYDHRRNLMIGGYVVMGVGFAIGFGTLISDLGSRHDCPLGDPNFGNCIDQNGPHFTGPLIGMGIGALGMGFGLYYHFHPHPISENEAKNLADGYNQGLRHQLGLPVVSRAPLLHDFQLRPYVDADRGGLVLAARF